MQSICVYHCRSGYKSHRKKDNSWKNIGKKIERDGKHRPTSMYLLSMQAYRLTGKHADNVCAIQEAHIMLFLGVNTGG